MLEERQFSVLWTLLFKAPTRARKSFHESWRRARVGLWDPSHKVFRGKQVLATGGRLFAEMHARRAWPPRRRDPRCALTRIGAADVVRASASPAPAELGAASYRTSKGSSRKSLCHLNLWWRAASFK